ncbi:E3 ubiquitin-protein ligase RFWD3 [Nasonia vitripennis]|uniref:RING-type E3 ubiquitin transferase n=1 Tax=Nasonia vitripennis TaxID=7425 RepID=A0A7M7IRX3_NASVI|nr:E3 ubiquitin-protein ligase RFWD3 [Nasonia vitripennis]
MEDDDDYSDSNYGDIYVGSNYLGELYERLTADENASMSDDDSSEAGSDGDLYVMYDDIMVDDSDIDDDDLTPEYNTTQPPDEASSQSDDMLASSDDDDERLSEASTVINQDQDHPSDADVEVDQPDEEVIEQSQKRIKLDVPEPQSAQAIADETIGEDHRCPICLELWSNSGEHRLCSLRCGHLFGLKCIEQWFNIAQNATGRKCPECNTKASKKDIRILYAKNLVCVDTSEIEKLKEELKVMTTKKDSAEMLLKQYKSKETLYEQQLSSLRRRIQDLEQKVKIISENNTFSMKYDNAVLKRNKVFDICNAGTCRVMAYNQWHKILVVSAKNAISRIFMETSSASTSSIIHDAVIRDMAFQEQHPDMLLSVGFDKKVKLTDIKSNILVHSYQAESNLWSCCWSNYSYQTFFVGDVRGAVTEYDIRYLQSGVSTKENTQDRTPVVSLASVPTTSQALRAGGYLACQLNSCYAYGCKEGNRYVGNKIDVEGPFTSLQYNERDNHVLLSSRASTKHPLIRHIVCTIEKSEDKIYFNKVHLFNAGSSQKLLSRPCYMNLQNDTMVVAYNESLSSVVAWSITSGQQTYSLPMSEPVLDVCSFGNDANMYQAILTSKKLHLYNHKDTSI